MSSDRFTREEKARAIAACVGLGFIVIGAFQIHDGLGLAVLGLYVVWIAN